MRRLSFFLTLALPVVIVVSCQKNAKEDLVSNNEEFVTGQGNNAPSGQHYNLNIIGVSNPKKFNFNESEAEYTQGNGHVIFVNLVGRTKILLKEGDFEVLDANGTDGIAAFQLPEPDDGNDGVTDYSVFVRGLGKPGGQAVMRSCFFDQQTQTEFCSTDEEFIVTIEAHGNNNKFQNVTNQLLFIWADVDGDGDVDRTELFSDILDEYYWYYDNNRLKIAQLRFYPNVGTDVLGDPE